MTFFKRKGWEIGPGKSAADFRPGDVVTWNLGSGITHIGIISDRKAASGNPQIIHNIGRGTQEEDLLFAYKIIGHYRPRYGAGAGASTGAILRTVTPGG